MENSSSSYLGEEKNLNVKGKKTGKLLILYVNNPVLLFQSVIVLDGIIADLKRGRTILPLDVVFDIMVLQLGTTILDVTEKTRGIPQDVANKTIIIIIANLL